MLNTDVPVISFDFHIWIQVKFDDSVDLDSSEIIVDGFILCNCIFTGVIGKSRSSHGYHSQAPGSYIFKFDISDADDHIEEAISVAIFFELSCNYSLDVEMR